MKRPTLLVVAPHCDDAELGCGGYMARCAKEGWQVVVLVVTVGDITFLHSQSHVTIDERKQEIQAASKVLGFEYEFLTVGHDTRLHTVPKGEIIQMLDHHIEAYHPNEILVPLPSAHQDHKYVWEVSVAATRPSMSKWAPQLIAAYEYPLSGWGEGAESNAFRGGLYVNITDFIELKKEALLCYPSQMRGDNHLIGLDGCEALARLRGIEAGYRYAELFHVLRQRRS